MTFAQACTDSLVEVLRNADKIGKKAVTVYSQNDLLAKFSQTVIKLPAAGVLYEGTRATGDNRAGVSAEIVCSIMLLADNSKALGPTNNVTKDPSLELLDDVRHVILGTRSPTMHFWKFVIEAPAMEVKGGIVWLQRWSTPVQVISRSP